MSSFPFGCCSYASNLLNKHLMQYGINTVFVSGRYGYGPDGEKHEWLETDDGIVIDITGDQYKYKQLKFVEPVWVWTRKNGFHDKFELDEPIPYLIDEDLYVSYSDFDRRYDSIMRYYTESDSRWYNSVW